MRRKVILGVVAVVVLALALAATNRELRDQLRFRECFSRPRSDGLVALGDSVTIGFFGAPDRWIQAETSWVAHATCGTELTYGYNAGVAGATTEQMAERVSDALDHDPRWFVVLGGTNDVLEGIPPAEAIRNLDAILQAAADVETVAIGTIPPSDDPTIHEPIARLNAGIRQLATDRGVRLIDFHEVVGEGDRYAPGFAFDAYHPNAAGARLMGDLARSVLLAP